MSQTHSIIDILSENFGDEWVTYKRGSHIKVRALILAIFIELISQKKLIKPLYSSYSEFYEIYKNDELMKQAIEKGDNYDCFISKIKITDSIEKISNDYIKEIFIDKNLNLSLQDLAHVNNIIAQLIKLVKSDNDNILKYKIQQDNEEISDSDDESESDIDTNDSTYNVTMYKMFRIANYVNICKNFITPENNFGLIFMISTKLTDGYDSEFKTGGCPTVPTQIREHIVKNILNHVTKLRSIYKKNNLKNYKKKYRDFTYSPPKKRRKSNKSNSDSSEKLFWIYSDGTVEQYNNLSNKKNISNKQNVPLRESQSESGSLFSYVLSQDNSGEKITSDSKMVLDSKDMISGSNSKVVIQDEEQFDIESRQRDSFELNFGDSQEMNLEMPSELTSQINSQISNQSNSNSNSRSNFDIFKLALELHCYKNVSSNDFPNIFEK
jgi:hypothetical protein